MEKLGYRIVTFLLLFIGSISKSLSILQRGKFGEFIGDLLRILSKKRQNITFDNISKAYPEMDSQWINNVLVSSYRNLGITLVELLAFESISDSELMKYMKFENIELVNEILSRNKGLILLSGHIGNWEMVAFSIGWFSGNEVNAIVKPQKNIFSDRILNKYRSLRGNKIILSNNSARGVVQALLQKKIVGILADQSATIDKDVFVEFFGRNAATYEAPAALALKLNVPIIMGYPVRQEDYSYKINLYEIDFSDLQNDKNGIIELTKRHVKELENAIRENPGQWSWQHRRWKHSLDISNEN